MDTTLQLPYRHREPLPEGEDSEVRTPPALVEAMLREYSDPGGTVLDPFAGYGTTLRVATAMDREAYGVEYEADRVAYVRERGDHGRIRQGDARELDGVDLPPVDCVYTSPPFMVAAMTDDPLRNYDGESDYGTYLDEMRTVFEGVREQLRVGGHALVEVSNMKHDGEVTTLAWDLADSIRDVLHFEGEVVVTWAAEEADRAAEDRDGAFGYGYDHSYCLVFSN